MQTLVYQGASKASIFEITFSKTINWMQSWLTLDTGYLHNTFPAITDKTWSPPFYRDWQVKWTQQLNWNGWTFATTLWFADGNDPDFSEVVWLLSNRKDSKTGEKTITDLTTYQNEKTKLYHRFDIGIKKSVSDFLGLDITMGMNIINVSAYKNNLRHNTYFENYFSDEPRSYSSEKGIQSSGMSGLSRTVLGYLSIAF